MSSVSKAAPRVVFDGGSCDNPGCTLDVSVIVPVFNAGGLLREQVLALSEQDTPLHWELILTDNGSTDGSTEAVRDLAHHFAHFREVDASARQGPAFARNSGAGVALGTILMFCDADDVADPLWLHELWRATREHHFVGGRLALDRLNHSDSIAWRRPLQDTSLPHYYGCDYSASSNLGVSAELFRSLDGFDESFPSAAFEDVDLSLRAHRAGVTPAFCGQAVMHYRLREDLPATLRQAQTYGASSRLLFERHPRSVIAPPSVVDDAIEHFRLAKRRLRQAVRPMRSPGTLEWERAYARAQTRSLVGLRSYWSPRRRYPDEFPMPFTVVQRRRLGSALTRASERLSMPLPSSQPLDWASPWSLQSALMERWSPADRHLLGAGLLADADVTIETRRDGTTWYLNPSLDPIVNEVIRTGGYGTRESDLILRHLASKNRTPAAHGVIINVGANVGTTALPLARAGYRVVAAEPVQRAFDLLCRNVEVNGFGNVVQPFNAAVTATHCNVEIVAGDNLSTSELKGAHDPADLATPSDFGVHVEVVRGIPLDSLIDEAGVDPGQVALVWSDTEGAEAGVIAGGTRLWAAGVPLWVEIRPSALRDQGRLTDFVGLAQEWFSVVRPLDDLSAGRNQPLAVSDLREFIDSIGHERYAFTNVLLSRD